MNGPGLLGLALSLFLSPAHGSASIQVHAHRGGPAELPQNTLPAFENAIQMGADSLEMDARLTADGELILHHDARIDPTLCPAQGRDRIRALPASELLRLSCPGGPSGDFPQARAVPGNRLLLLRDLVQWLSTHPDPRASRVLLNIEIKAEPEKSALALASLIRQYRIQDRVIVESFLPGALLAMRKLMPEVQRSLLTLGAELPLALTLARLTDAQWISPSVSVLCRRSVARFHRAGLGVIAYTANQGEDWVRLREWGVDAIITDDPRGLLQFLGRPPREP